MTNEEKCKYYDPINGWCEKLSNFGYPKHFEYCPKSPCDHAELIEQVANDNDIIKALECCVHQNCAECQLDELAFCMDALNSYALDLINRQKAENERLQKRLEGEKHALFEQQAYTAELQKEVDATYKLLELKREEERREHELNMDALKEIKSLLPNAIYRAKSEAVKEFAERLKCDITINNTEDGCLIYSVDYGCLMEDIDNLVKEMTEGEDESVVG